MTDGGADVTGDYAIGVEIVRRALSEPATLIAANAGYPAADVVAATALLGTDDGFDALVGAARQHDLDGHRRPAAGGPVRPAERRLGRRAAAHHQHAGGRGADAWGGSAALMTEYGSLDEGLHQPSPDSSTPQSLGLGPSVG